MSTSFPRQVLVVGYYDHCNLGDEQYKKTIPYLLNRVFYKNYAMPCITFIDCDQLASFPINDLSTTMVLLGGGDVLNAYFLDKIYTKFAGKRPMSLVALSVGIPYNDVYLSPESRTKLQLFDHIFLRTKQDVQALNCAMQPITNVHYLPDTSCFVLEYMSSMTTTMTTTTTPSFRTTFQHIQEWRKTRKIVGIMLCRHMYHPDSPYKEQYQEIVVELARMMEQLIHQNYCLVLVPFNTKPTPKGMSSCLNKENDVLMQRDVMKQIQRAYLPSVISIEFPVTTEQTMLLYKQFYLTIPMRFHATLFSVYARVPMIPIYTTKKIKNFLLDIHWPYEYVLDKNAKDLPTQFDMKRWMLVFHTLTRPAAYLAGKKRLLSAYHNFKRISIERTALIRICMENDAWNHVVDEYESNMCLFPLIYPENPTPLPRLSLILPHLAPMDVSSVSSSLSSSSSLTLFHTPSLSPLPSTLQKIYDKLQTLAQEHGLSDFRDIRDPPLQDVAVSVVSYYLTHHLESPYHHGLLSKMFAPTYDYRSEWMWIMKDQEEKEQTTLHIIQGSMESPPKNNTVPPPYGMRFNLMYIDQNDQSGVHRSGWKYVYDAIQPYHSDSSAHLLLDLYVDRTFHWKHDIYRQIDVIPYTRPWVGFIHHTFDTEFSEYNNTNLLKCPEFIQSLAYCRGLIVLSKTLQTQFLEMFQETCDLTHPVPVFALTHPTEMQVTTFQYSAFLNNPDKKLLHIGGWMRNIFSFYQLILDQSFSVVTQTASPPFLSSPSSNTLLASSSPIPSSPLSPSRWTKYFGCCAKSSSVPVQVPIVPVPVPVPVLQTITLRKVILKGKNMDNYFPQLQHLEKLGEMVEVTKRPNMVLGTLGTIIEDEEEKYCSSSNNHTRNNWWKHMMKYVHHVYENKVDVQEYLDNAAYDDLMTKNIVFLNLVDGSAVNTLIECVVRNTPILVNRHPAVVEVLGDEYPLYYETDENGNPMHIDLSSSPDQLYRAHVYLTHLDKTPFRIETFVQHLNKLFQEGLVL
jgi:hypothetical protein